MSVYVADDLAFELPVGCEDLTAHTLEIDLPGGDLLLVLVERAPLDPPASLAAVVAEHNEGARRRLAFHRVLVEQPIRAGGAEGVEVVSTWGHAGKDLYVRDAHVAHAGRRLLLSTAAPIAHRAACDAFFERMIATLDLRPSP